MLLLGSVRSQVTNLLIGSEEAVERHSLREGRIFDISIIQVLNGSPIEIRHRGWNTNFTSKVTLYNHFHSNLITMAQKAIDVDFGQDRDKPFWVYADYYRMVNGPGVPYRPVYYYVAFAEFSLVKTGNTYSLPQDLSDIPMEFPSDYVVYTIPKYAWAQVETVASNGDRVRLVDSENPQEGFDLARSLILVPTHHAVTGDSFKTTIRVLSGDDGAFRVFDEHGMLRPEASPRLVLNRSESIETLGISLNGGEPGRIYSLQDAPSLDGPWREVHGKLFTNLPPYLSPGSVTASPTGDQYFRLAVTNLVPGR